MHDLLAQSGQSMTLPVALAWITGAWESAWPYLVMVLGFSLIIFVHELGHFIVAKWAGVRVERFAIGFGREVAGFTKGETRYSFNILPFGGYVKMLGQEDFDDKSKELQFKDDPRSFVNKTVSRRMAIVSAGVVMNVLFAGLLFMIVFLIGMEAQGTRIGLVEPDSPANKAGLRPGDNIVSINGKKILEFYDVRVGILLAPPHRPIEFVVEREGKTLDPIYLTPDYRSPESTRELRRLFIGIAQGVTNEIVAVGPEIDTSDPARPHVGDILVEVDGIEVSDSNANDIQEMLVYTKGDVFVEREDSEDPEAPPILVRVDVPPQLAIYPSDSAAADSVNVLGLAPLVRFGAVDPDGRAYLAGIEVGDTVLSWDDQPLPNRTTIARAIRHNPETDVAFKLRKADGRIVEGFVRPKGNRYGRATIQAVCGPIDEEARLDDGPKAVFETVRPFGRTARAGIEPGSKILSFDGMENPSHRDVNRVVQKSTNKTLPVTLRRPDGSVFRTVVEPQAPGSIDASFNLVADDVMTVGEVAATINGRPSPAAKAGIPPGVTIASVNGQRVSDWRELIAAFRAHAGTAVQFGYLTQKGEAQAAAFDVPHCLRTLLGVGPEARILAIDGRDTVAIESSTGTEEVHVGYHRGTRAILTELVGQQDVKVEYRPNPLSTSTTKLIDVTADMVDPWVGRIAFAPNVLLAPQTKLLKGENALDALWIGIHKTYYFILQVYQMIDRMLFSRSVGVESISGPLGIVSIGGQIARAGLVNFLFFMAILSANLAVINFLPLPIVDGGLMVFLIIEKIKGSPVSLRVQVATQVIGLFLIVGAFVVVTYNDALRLLG